MKHELMKELVERLNNATKAYDVGRPYISDADWDRLYGELEKYKYKLNMRDILNYNKHKLKNLKN